MNNGHTEITSYRTYKNDIEYGSKIVEPSISEIENLYPGISKDFDYGLIISILDYMKEIKAVFVYPFNQKVFVSAGDGQRYSLGEILLYSENIYQERLHN